MAVTEADETARGGSSSEKLKGNASDKTTDAARACSSFWDVEEARAGATGAEGAFGLTQHARVEQCLESQRGPQQLILARRAFAPVPADAVMEPCQARTNPSTRTTAIFTGRNVIAAIGGFGYLFSGQHLLVTQICNLPFRRFAIGKEPESSSAFPRAAECNSAIQLR